MSIQKPTPWRVQDNCGLASIFDATDWCVLSGISLETAGRIVDSVNACAGISRGKLQSWLNPPAGSKGLPDGPWTQQLVEVCEAGNTMVSAYDKASQDLMQLNLQYGRLTQQRTELLAALKQFMALDRTFEQAERRFVEDLAADGSAMAKAVLAARDVIAKVEAST